MSTNLTPLNPWIHRLAVLTTVLSMLPIFLGAMTTTKGAGMAFPDWPTSDGQGMFSYPWLRLVNDMGTNPASYEKFLEHSHRLAGVLIGLAAIGLAVVTCLKGSTYTLMTLGSCILVSVIIQGLLGGYRVELNERGLAMIHGLFASLVFALMCITCTVSSAAWYQTDVGPEAKGLKLARNCSLAFLMFLIVQYALGGLIRHPLGGRSPIHEHLGFGILALILVHGLLFVIIKTRQPWLRQSMRWLLLAVGAQVLLGLFTYAFRFGFSPLGINPVAGSAAQVLTRTGHMMLGVLVVGAAAVLMVKCFRMNALARRASL